MMEKRKIGVIGTGSWGTALGLHLYDLGHHISYWEYDKDRVETIRLKRINDLIPFRIFPDDVFISHEIEDIVLEKDILILAVPSHAMRSVCKRINAVSPENSPLIVNIAKGIEATTLMRMSEVVSQVLTFPRRGIVTVSGPSHAEEVIKKQPTAVVAVSESLDLSEEVQLLLMDDRLRVYRSDDLVGVELGGSLKNVIAIAAGISDGVGFGDNAKAALIVRGAYEIMKIGLAMGARPETFSGLTGMGDLIVTCISKHSRNRYVGEELGRGKSLETILESMKMVAEGVITTQSAIKLSEKCKVDLPVAQAVYQVMFHHADPLEEVNNLMSREPKPESLQT
jgi:glycerol-3-phosphate dehydrogenase (NAD(P)+)